MYIVGPLLPILFTIDTCLGKSFSSQVKGLALNTEPIWKALPRALQTYARSQSWVAMAMELALALGHCHSHCHGDGRCHC